MMFSKTDHVEAGSSIRNLVDYWQIDDMCRIPLNELHLQLRGVSTTQRFREMMDFTANRQSILNTIKNMKF